MTDEKLLEIKFQDGKVMKFEPMGSVAYKGNLYALLQPQEAINGMDLKKDNMAIVFKVTRTKEGFDRYDVEPDQETIDNVFKLYLDIYGDKK